MNRLKTVLKNKKTKRNKLIEELNEKNKHNELLNKIDLIVNGKLIKFTDKEIEVLSKSVNNENFSNDEKKRLNFVVNVLLPNRIVLDDNQKGLLIKISNYINDNKTLKSDKIKELESLVERIDSVLNVIEANKTINLTELKKLLSDLDLPLEEILSLIKEAVNQNIDVIEKNNTVSNNGLDDDVKKLFDKYGYNYDSMLTKNKEALKSASLKQIEEVLQTLDEINIKYSIGNPKQESEFVDILINGKKETILEFYSICIENNLRKFIPEIIRTRPGVLLDIKKIRNSSDYVYSNQEKDSSKSEQSKEKRSYQSIDDVLPTDPVFHRFKENVSFLKSKLEKRNINIMDIFKKNQSLFFLGTKPLKRNWHILEDIYGIEISSTCCVGHRRPYEAFDKYIEAFSQGWEYIKHNPSKLLYYKEPDDFIRFRVAEKAGKSIIVRRGRNIVQSSELKREYDKEVNEFEMCTVSINPDSKNKYDELMDFLEFDDIDTSILENEFISFLEAQYKPDDFTYIIGSTRISRQKVLRICSILLSNGIELGEEEILYALSYKSILDENDVYNIENFKDLDKNKKKGKTNNG